MQAAQVYFPKADYARIKAAAKDHGVSFAAFVREATIQKERGYSSSRHQKRAKDITSIKVEHPGTNDTALNHDKYIY